MLHQSLQDALPVLLQRRVAMARHRDPSVLIFDCQLNHINKICLMTYIRYLDLIEFYVICTILSLGLHGLEAEELRPVSLIDLHVFIDPCESSLCRC